ncbi:hypothetical protein EV363DRAFT_1478632, partial [Boletus edulis]
MQDMRWYSAAEALGDGIIVLIGGYISGGYTRGPATVMNFMITTSGLNSYAHTYLMPWGKLLLVAVRWKIVTIDDVLVLWDPDQNIEAPLPDMPNGVVRVYPASGAVAMLPLTPATNYTPPLFSFAVVRTCPQITTEIARGHFIIPGHTPHQRTVNVSRPSLRTVLRQRTINTTQCSWAVQWVGLSTFPMGPCSSSTVLRTGPPVLQTRPSIS